MEEEIKSAEPHLGKNVSNLVDTYLALTKANVTRKTADVVSFSITGLIIAVLAIMALLFASAGTAWWIGELLSNRVAGFLIVAGFYVLLLILVIAFKEQLFYRSIRNTIVRKAYE